jgi:serine protease Do
MKRNTSSLLTITIGVIIGLGLAIGCNFTKRTNATNESNQQTESKINEAGTPTASADPNLPNIIQLNEYFVNAAAKVTPSVVSVFTEKTVKNEDPFHGQNPFGNDEFFKFFGGPQGNNPFNSQQEPQKVTGLGSGVIISADGYILTNNHVVAETDEIQVKTTDGKVYEATITGTDARSDVALIKIETTGLTPAVIGDSDKLKVGEWVLAIGSPFGLSHTVTAGIISAFGRFPGINEYEDFIQTDAAVNPGNSGGALINIYGELVGINDAITSNPMTQGYLGISFAIPINMAKNIMDQIREKGFVERGYIGVSIGNIDPDLATAWELDDLEGVMVNDVFENTPAAKAKLQSGDIIKYYDNKKVKDADNLRILVANTKPGSTITLQILRDHKKEMTLELKVEAQPEGFTTQGKSMGQPVTPSTTETSEFDAIGLSVRNLTTEDAEKYGYDLGQGVIITKIDAAGPAADKGLRVNDVILKVNNEPISSVEQMKKILKGAEDTKSIALYVTNPEHASRYIGIKPKKK